MASFFSESGKHSFVWKSNKKLRTKPVDLDFQENTATSSSSKSKARNLSFSEKERLLRSVALKEEGSVLAGQEKYSDALKKWNEAINLNPHDEILYEMKAQVLMILEKDFLAVQCAEKAIQTKKHWWIGWQTLGRSQINIKDVDMAIKSFSRALHLNPMCEPDDLHWAVSLRTKANSS
ncbi:tetratricopeptide repeat protein 33-like [Clavelina lepadiformis]|uniref:tetratricopeptide repeat protein 33-like n=1 Tax=Clavelina lepadiformis TaxID=159417 RepID=UPI004042F380